MTLPLEVELREPGRKIRVQYRSVAIHHCTEPYSEAAYKINNTVVTHLVLVCKQNDIPGCFLQKRQLMSAGLASEDNTAGGSNSTFLQKNPAIHNAGRR